MSEVDGDPEAPLTLWQRFALRKLRKAARKRPGESLNPDDWETYFAFMAKPSNRAVLRMMHALPSSPRCGYCGAPFAGIGGRMVRPLGYRPSRKNPNLCSTCVELAPPGGTTMQVGVLFADIRGFTSLSEGSSPEQVSRLLRRFYACAEDTFFPEALIDKLIGDEVMALYVPAFIRPNDPSPGDPSPLSLVAPVMLDHARTLQDRVTQDEPIIEIGIGMDFGEAFIGNIGDSAVIDFTAVGDVVNTAARLQGEARSGDILVSSRLADGIDQRLSDPVELTVKGKAEPVAAYRIGSGAR